ncbi:MAG: AraC family transcriptional regulator [Oryzomonas sp.]|uniref:AraC family transcriptional regulator n=1 Tax=Oryzomonas sp. TaxID=2855186 RepID=UPI002850ADF8|nr:AraC family transcriptional regulator [Oryzomonas sp.]MDR3578964.1 AraC family transcriptional regulator [Oryzomonas sp.]
MQDSENNSMEHAIEALGKSIARWTDRSALIETAIPGLLLYRHDEPTLPRNAMYEPCICMVAQGAKRVLLGDDAYVYDAHHYLIASAGSQSRQIARAIDWLKADFSQPLSIDDLAAQVRMSSSTFHHHFRSMTALSPLQFQKQLRLQEARRLMLTEHLDAATAAFQVGYESPSQFSREYNRVFGAPPLRDITKLRQISMVE